MNIFASPDADIDADINADTYTITIGQLSDTGCYVQIPVGVFGEDDESLTGATIDLYLNGSLISTGIDPVPLYFSGSDLVIFNINPLYATDVLGFAINSAEGASTYYEGVISADSETYALLAVADFTDDSEIESIETFFDDKEAQEGDALGSDYTGTYTVYFDGITYSEDCDASFVLDADFYIDSTLTVEEAADVLVNGEEASEASIALTQTDGYFVWDDLSADGADYAGDIYSEGSFEFFDGDYVDENNYWYVVLQGSTNGVHVTGELIATIVLDGTRLENELVGSCTVSSEFTTDVE